jgi:mannose-6-phosphate isomerase-like protein (cupin superfamily)
MDDLSTLYYQTSELSRHTTIVRLSLPPGAGPSAHYHKKMEESFLVLEGTFSFFQDGDKIEGGPGTFAFIPPTKPHHFKNVGNTVGRVLCICAPPGHEGYFRELEEVDRKGIQLTREQLRDLRARYDTVQL